MAKKKGRKEKGRVRPAIWTSWHICQLDQKNEWARYPVADALASGDGDDPDTAVQKMKLFETLGWPAARASLFTSKADDKSPDVGILKCKPSCWRLYFHVFEQENDVKRPDKRILYLLAICKRQDAQQKENTTRARNLLTAALDGRIRISRWSFPADTAVRETRVRTRLEQ